MIIVVKYDTDRRSNTRRNKSEVTSVINCFFDYHLLIFISVHPCVKVVLLTKSASSAWQTSIYYSLI